MTVKVEVHPSAEAGLLEQAQSCGLSLEEYARQVLEDRAAGSQIIVPLSAQDRLSAFEEFLAGFESPVTLPEEAFERENWYPDR